MTGNAKPFPAALRHNSITPLFDDVWSVQGTVKMAPGMTFNRTMTILRHGRELSLINAVRLSQPAEAELDRLGEVKHVLRIGDNHGMDDAYYVDRYQAEMWCLEGAENYSEPAPTRRLEEGAALPVPELELYLFRLATIAEAVLVLPRHGGLLISCDSLQHWSDTNFCSLPIRLMMPFLGFRMGTLVGPPWSKKYTPKSGTLQPDFERIAALDFAHHIGAHGGLCRDTAKQEVRDAIGQRFGGA